MFLSYFFFLIHGDHRELHVLIHSVPTRGSSDLRNQRRPGLMSLFSVFNVAGSGMAAQSLRLNTVASNLANADSVASTPDAAYRSREPLFAAVKNSLAGNGDAPGEGVQVLGVTESQRSEEHTSELQSLMRISYAVFCLKKKHIIKT